MTDYTPLPPDIDTEDADTLTRLLEDAEFATAAPLETVIRIGGALPAGAVGGYLPNGEFTVRCTSAVESALAALTGTKPLQQKRRKVERVLRLLREVGPGHPSLHSHRYDDLQGRNGEPLWQSYVEHKTPNAWRAWWHFVLDEDRTILVAAVGPHPKRSLPSLPAY